MANLTIEKIQEKVAEGQPFYVNAAFNVLHDPYIVPAEFYEMFPLDEIELPENFGALEERFLRDWAKEVNV